MTNLTVQLGERALRIAIGSRRAARMFRRALSDTAAAGADSASLGYVLFGPHRGERHFRLADRSGIELARSRDVAHTAAALANHLTGLLPPRSGTVRLRGRVLVGDRQTVLGIAPSLVMPVPSDADLASNRFRIVDRLTVDIDIATGEIDQPTVPWPELARLGTPLSMSETRPDAASRPF